MSKGDFPIFESVSSKLEMLLDHLGKAIRLKHYTYAAEKTNGCNWILARQDPILLEQVGEAEATPESDQLGAPGKIVLQFKAVAQGQTLLHLDYKRAWETDVAPEKSLEVTVVVE